MNALVTPFYRPGTDYESRTDLGEEVVLKYRARMEMLDVAIDDQALATGVIRKMFASLNVWRATRAVERTAVAVNQLRPMMLVNGIKQLPDNVEILKPTGAAELPFEDETPTSQEAFCTDGYITAASTEDLNNQLASDS